VELPDGWERVSADGPGPFVTREVLRSPDGRLVEWRSRPHRKRAGRARAGVWWRPDRTAWWIGVLFAIGSVCFLVASMVSQWASAPRSGIGVTFFVGSLLFTSAGYLQYAETVNVDRGPGRRGRERWRPVSWEPARIDWLAAAVQFAGTLLFNVTTFEAMKRGLDTRQSNLRVWTPNALGSICFLVASTLAFAEVCHRWTCVRRRSLSWWIVALNLLGSVAFGVSAAAALIEPSTNEPVSAAIANAGTSLGAACFLLGAVLLLPEARAHEAAPADGPTRPRAAV
jgi:hypothetical protein